MGFVLGGIGRSISSTRKLTKTLKKKEFRRGLQED